MKNFLFWISTALIVAFWPASLILANSDSWTIYLSAGLALLLGWILYIKGWKHHYFIFLVLPLIHPVYLIFPIVFFLFSLKDNKRIPALFLYLGLFISVFVFSAKTFYEYSIFTPDPLAFDTLTKKISSIPNRSLAKIFENRTTIAQEKYKSNVFLSLDVNNYFFGLHPREIVGDNQNLTKFPYLALVPFLFGLFFLPENKHWRWIIASFVSSALALAFINNQDKFDFVIFFPVFLLCFYGLRKMRTLSSTFYYLFSAIFIITSFIELARIFIFR